MGVVQSSAPSHALSCQKGGLVIQWQNKVRDSLGDLASLVWSKVKLEPVVKESDNMAGTPALVADMTICGIWMPQAEVLFDVCVIDTDAQSYCNECQEKHYRQPRKRRRPNMSQHVKKASIPHSNLLLS